MNVTRSAESASGRLWYHCGARLPGLPQSVSKLTAYFPGTTPVIEYLPLPLPIRLAA